MVELEELEELERLEPIFLVLLFTLFALDEADDLLEGEDAAAAAGELCRCPPEVTSAAFDVDPGDRVATRGLLLLSMAPEALVGCCGGGIT